MKNLSANQINLSTLKGEGELSSINLDEKALEELIELPTWLTIQKATCGRAFIKVEKRGDQRQREMCIGCLDPMDEFENIAYSNRKGNERETSSLMSVVDI